MDRTLSGMIDTAGVKFNCDVSDARYWGYFSICGLLMRYRDLFRSEKGLAPWDDVPQDAITEWIRRKESRWPELETAEFRGVAVDGVLHDPFAVEEINAGLASRGLLYGAGYGMYGKPTFFLAELTHTEKIEGRAVSTVGRELVRDLFSAAGMHRERAIVIRQDPLTALLWDKFQMARARPDSPLGAAFASYGLTASVPFDAVPSALTRIAGRYAGVLVRHELAESIEDAPGWKDVLLAAGDRDVEHFVRSVKDLVADTSPHGPLRMIFETRDAAGLGLSAALLDGYRRVLFPELREAHDRVIGGGAWDVLERVRSEGYEAFHGLQNEIIGYVRMNDEETGFSRKVRALIERFPRGCLKGSV